ncbi:hypothetical protein FB451DRAFT_1269416, partial [Mycena latifolia]
MNIRASMSPLNSPDIPVFLEPPTPLSAALPSREDSLEADSNGCSKFADDTRTAGITAVEDHSCRLPLSDVHNTATVVLMTTEQDTNEAPEFLEASRLFPPSRIHLAALISPSKAPRLVDRGPDPVYHYGPEAPAVAVAKSIARPVQDEFKNFSAGLGVKFGLRGWAAAGPNELAPPKKNNKKKKKVVAKGTHATPSPSPVTVLGVSCPPSPTAMLLPAFEPRHDYSFKQPLPTPAYQHQESSRFVIDSTLPSGIARESVSSERVVNTGCHPDCADIYCPGGCSGIEC